MQTAGSPVSRDNCTRQIGLIPCNPSTKAIVAETRAPGLLATDATGIPVLNSDTPDGIRNGTMWCWTNARWVTFFYSPQADSESVRRFLGDDLARVVQCDGTSVMTFFERKGGQRPGCWSHARRRFADSARVGTRLRSKVFASSDDCLPSSVRARVSGKTTPLGLCDESRKASLSSTNCASGSINNVRSSRPKLRSAKRSAICIGSGPGSLCFSRMAISSSPTTTSSASYASSSLVVVTGFLPGKISAASVRPTFSPSSAPASHTA